MRHFLVDVAVDGNTNDRAQARAHFWEDIRAVPETVSCLLIAGHHEIGLEKINCGDTFRTRS